MMGTRVKSQKGMTIIEMAITLAVLAVAGGALVSMGLTTVALSTSSKLRSRATALAVDRIEQVRACRDENNEVPLGLVDCGMTSPETIDVFKRTTTISPLAGGATAGVVVEWNERGVARNVTLQTKLYQWKVREATQ